MTNYSMQLRIWHWLNALIVFGLLGTFYLRETFLNWHRMSRIITEKLATFDITVTTEQARSAAMAIRAQMWDWHMILGYAFCVLVLWRLVMLFREGFGYAPETMHMAWVYRGYKLLYAVLAFMGISGLVLNYYKMVGVPKFIVNLFREGHEIFAWGIAIFVVLHIIGVFFADNRDQKGITSKMISGH